MMMIDDGSSGRGGDGFGVGVLTVVIDAAAADNNDDVVVRVFPATVVFIPIPKLCLLQKCWTAGKAGGPVACTTRTSPCFNGETESSSTTTVHIGGSSSRHWRKPVSGSYRYQSTITPGATMTAWAPGLDLCVRSKSLMYDVSVLCYIYIYPGLFKLVSWTREYVLEMPIYLSIIPIFRFLLLTSVYIYYNVFLLMMFYLTTFFFKYFTTTKSVAGIIVFVYY